jgi:dihydroflavonol-4-reductase
VRRTSPRLNLAKLDVEIVEGDICDAEAVSKAMRGSRYLFHAAADYRLWARNPDIILRNNKEGTKVLMQAALAAGTERIVYTSSVATLACGKNGDVSDESMALCEDAAIGAYKRSKVQAERIVQTMIEGEALPAIIVHPSTPVGPGDIKPTPTGRIIVEAAKGHIPGYVDSGLNLVHVDDVARGHLAALLKGRIGEHYILGGQNVSLSQLFSEIAVLSGRKPPKLCFSRPLLYPFAYFAEAIAYITKKEPFLTVDGLHMAKHRMFFSSAKAECELGYKARPYAEGLIDALAWFQANGHL